jgi:hypothetical protein
MDKNTVNDVILRVGPHCAKVLGQLLASLSLTGVQLDELWAFVKKKECDEPSGEDGAEPEESAGFDDDSEESTPGTGRTWIWTAIDVSSRLLFIYRIGGRTLHDAELFIDDMAGRLSTMPFFVSDELPQYATALARRFRTVAPVPPTGKPGRPKKPAQVADKQLKYGTVHKVRKGGKIIEVRRKILFGDKDEINKY